MSKQPIEIEIETITEMMEEMAGGPKEEFGKRQPGERGKYESSTLQERTV